MLDLGKVPFAHPHQGRAIEGRIAADPIVGVGRERVAVLVQPLLLGPVALADKDVLGAPVLRLARQVLAPVQNQDRLAGRSQGLGHRRAACARADDDDVIGLRHLQSSVFR